MLIHRTSCRAQPIGGHASNRPPVREPCLPLAQQPVLTSGALEVLLDTAAAFGGDRMTERRCRGYMDAVRLLGDPRSEDIQIMDLAEQTLDMSEAFIPR